jgi:rhodanese-related sulfurtransferase
MNSLLQLACIVAISGVAAGLTYGVRGAPSRNFVCDPASLKPDEICLEQVPTDSAILWVDARSRADWQRNGLPGSVLWNLDPREDMQVFEAEVAMRIVETPRVIIYCGDENCGVSRQVAGQIERLGMGAEVSVLSGGWRALSEAGRIPSAR